MTEDKALDITGREIKVGDVLAVGQRSGNSGALDIRVVSKVEKRNISSWNPDSLDWSVKTNAGGWLRDLNKVLIVPKDIFKDSDIWELVKDAN